MERKFTEFSEFKEYNKSMKHELKILCYPCLLGTMEASLSIT